MKRFIRTLVLAVAFVTGIMTVSAQTVQVVVIQKVAALPSTLTSYMDDPFRYFTIQFIVTGAGGDGIDVYFDTEITISTNPMYVRTRPGSVPLEPIHLSEGINIIKADMIDTQIRNRLETNIDYNNPLALQQLPEGTYQLCVDIYRWSDRLNSSGEPINIGECPTFEICYSGSAPELVSPMAGTQMALNGAMVVTHNRKINFFWTPVISNCAGRNTRFKYKLKVVRVFSGQNYNDAIKINPTVFSTEVRNGTHASLDTLRDVKVRLEEGALYVAQVLAEQISTNSRGGETFIIANEGASQPMPFYWGSCPEGTVDTYSRTYGYSVEEEDEEDDESEGVSGLTQWEGDVEEVSELDDLLEEAFPYEQSIVIDPKRHYVESDGYITVAMAGDLEVGFRPVQGDELKNVSYTLELYDYMEGGVDSITSYEPLFSEFIEELPESAASQDWVNRTLAGWGDSLVQGNLYYMQLSTSFMADYWNYEVADTSYYVNGYLAEHIHDTVSREYREDELVYDDGIFFQWGEDPDAPEFRTPQWKAPVDRSHDDIYDPASYEIPASIPEVQKAPSFPVSWTPVLRVAKGDEVEYEVNVYEVKSGQTPEEAVWENDPLVTRTMAVNKIYESDTDFFKVFSPKKTYVMTLSTSVDGESETLYHFANGNESLPIVFKIVK